MTRSWRARTLVIVAAATIASSLAVVTPSVVPAAQAEQLSVPVTWFETTIEDPTRWTPARGTQPAHAGRTLRTTFWYPTTGGPWPVIVFAHGFNTDPWTYEPLISALATSGYIVAAPDFPASSDRYDGAPSQADIPNQPGDLSAIVTATIGFNGDGASPLDGRVDVDRFGAAGHSDGGTTVAALVMHSATRDPRIRASAILSGGTWPIAGGIYGPFNTGAALFVHSTFDPIADPAQSIALYDAAAPPKAYVTIDGSGHLQPYLDATPQGDAVRTSIIAFLDDELRGDVSGLGRFLDASTRGPGFTFLSSSTLSYQPQPIGVVEAAAAGPDTMTVAGWALDDDTSAPIPVAVYVDGVGIGWFTADLSRPDVGNAYPGYGDAHGFSASFAIGGGTHNVCVYGINTGYGNANSLLSCRTVTVGGNPLGALDMASAGLDTINVAGWSLDPDTAASIPVAVYVDGIGVGWFTAANDRPDVAAAFPGYGGAHGYWITVNAPSGTHTVCVYGINQASGTGNPAIGCTSVTLPREPIGVVDAVWSTNGSIDVAGWALDPDTAGSIPVAVYVDGTIVGWFVAGLSRPDVAAVAPGYGPLHGYGVTFASPPGSHVVCVYGINAGSGTVNPSLGCRGVTVP